MRAPVTPPKKGPPRKAVDAGATCKAAAIAKNKAAPGPPSSAAAAPVAPAPSCTTSPGSFSTRQAATTCCGPTSCQGRWQLVAGGELPIWFSKMAAVVSRTASHRRRRPQPDQHQANQHQADQHHRQRAGSPGGTSITNAKPAEKKRMPKKTWKRCGNGRWLLSNGHWCSSSLKHSCTNSSRSTSSRWRSCNSSCNSNMLMRNSSSCSSCSNNGSGTSSSTSSKWGSCNSNMLMRNSSSSNNTPKRWQKRAG